LVISATGLAAAADAGTAPPQALPRLRIQDFRYVGAFRLPSRKYGPSDLNYSEGPIAFNPDRQSLFIVGHAHQQAIAEFAVPELVQSTVLTELNMAGDPIQPFVTVLDRASGANPEGNNRIGGLLYVAGSDGPELLVNAYEYYDAPGDNTLSMLVVRNAKCLAESAVDGYFEVQGRPGHTAGWMSPVPGPWQPLATGPRRRLPDRQFQRDPDYLPRVGRTFGVRFRPAGHCRPEVRLQPHRHHPAA
jgi:hypothetical protein